MVEVNNRLSIIYLATAIDRSDPARLAKIVETVQEEARCAGISSAIFLPSRAYLLADAGNLDSQKAVRSVNEMVLVNSSCMLVVYDPGVETWGVPQEVRLASEKGIPVILICSDPDLPLPMYLDMCVTQRYSSIDQFFTAFREGKAWNSSLRHSRSFR